MFLKSFAGSPSISCLLIKQFVILLRENSVDFPLLLLHFSIFPSRPETNLMVAVVLLFDQYFLEYLDSSGPYSSHSLSNTSL